MVSVREDQLTHEIIIDAVRQRRPGDSFTHGEFRSMTGLPMERLYYVISKANKTLLADDQVLLKNEYGLGYSIAYASDHVKLARKDAASGTRKFCKAQAKLHHTRLPDLTSEQRVDHDALAMALNAVQKTIQEVKLGEERIAEAVANGFAEAAERDAARAAQEDQWRVAQQKYEEEREARLVAKIAELLQSSR
jgi:hypothetical protein